MRSCERFLIEKPLSVNIFYYTTNLAYFDNEHYQSVDKKILGIMKQLMYQCLCSSNNCI